jgi:hypothetical protein
MTISKKSISQGKNLIKFRACFAPSYVGGNVLTLHKKACQRSPFGAKNVELTYVHRKRIE